MGKNPNHTCKYVMIKKLPHILISLILYFNHNFIAKTSQDETYLTPTNGTLSKTLLERNCKCCLLRSTNARLFFCVHLVVRDKYNLACVIVHRGHRLGALVENEVHLPLHLLTVRNTPHKFVDDLYRM